MASRIGAQIATERSGTCGAVSHGMGLILVLAVVAAVVAVGALFVHALRADPSEESHRWLVVVPLLIIFGWLLMQLIMGVSVP